MLVARRQVLERAVCSANIDMREFVAAAVLRDEDAVIGGEVADGEDCAGGGLRERGRVSARDRQRGGVVDAGLVVRQQQVRAIEREGVGRGVAHRHGRGVEEHLCIVRLVRWRRGGFDRCRLAGCERQCRH